MKIHRVVVGAIEENCYILEEDGKVLVVDPGEDFSKIKKAIGEKEVIGILITHRHYDHIGALKEVMDTYKCPVYEKENVEEKKYMIGSFSFTILFTEGHSKDSITFYFEKEKAMFVGDFVFEGTIGRCDLPTGDYNKMLKSIEKLKQYPNVFLYPGHGESTNLDKEKQENPYF